MSDHRQGFQLLPVCWMSVALAFLNGANLIKVKKLFLHFLTEGGDNGASLFGNKFDFFLLQWRFQISMAPSLLFERKKFERKEVRKRP